MALMDSPRSIEPSAARTAADAVANWLLCQAGSHRFALPLLYVIETMRPLPIEPLSGAPPLVRGLSIIRGAPVPVVDAAMLFDDQPAPCERLVTARTGERTIALGVQRVFGIRALQQERLDRLPPLLGDSETIAGIKILDRELMFFLHMTRIIPEEFFNLCDARGLNA
jgi:purine-binding chemotaxis protein CheW